MLQMKKFHHPNIAQFYGFSPQDLVMYVLYELAPRGSLVDIIHSNTVRLDEALRGSLTTDLTGVSADPPTDKPKSPRQKFTS